MRLVVTLVAVGLLTTGLFSGCASDSNVGAISGSGGAGTDASVQGGPGSSGMGPALTSTGTGEPAGSCNPSFCPEDGFGERCCVSPNGPCGVDMGMGCVSGATGDPGADGG